MLIFNTLCKQMVTFLLVGGVTFFIDYSLLVFCVEVLNIPVLVSTAFGFAVGSGTNYFLSRKYVFAPGKFNRDMTEFSVFMMFTTCGLILNHLIIYVGYDILSIDYKVSKIGSLIVVTCFNFLTKKYIVFRG